MAADKIFATINVKGVGSYVKVVILVFETSLLLPFIMSYYNTYLAKPVFKFEF